MDSKRKNSLFIGSFIALLILFSPYLLFINKGISEDLKSIDTIFGIISAGYYDTIYLYAYWFFSKFVPLFLLLIWFLTCKHWWVHAILIPITVYLFQLISVINDSIQYVDEVEFIYTVPIAVIIVVILYFIRSKMGIYILAVDLKDEMDENMKDPKKIG
ncbi:MAG: hypothetical protein COC16_00565 [Lutibacter sp.]|nr:MAG: hypothetical protein COC16_00565 [Lutibacter sp.]PHS51437.1 MAG: hypothetical protein COB01_10425 [Lutibacter sp.]